MSNEVQKTHHHVGNALQLFWRFASLRPLSGFAEKSSWGASPVLSFVNQLQAGFTRQTRTNATLTRKLRKLDANVVPSRW